MASSDSEVSFGRPQEAHGPAIASGIDRDEVKDMIKDAIEGLQASLMVALTGVMQNVVTTVVQNLNHNATQPHMLVAPTPGSRNNNPESAPTSSRTSRLNSSPLCRDRESSSDSQSQDLERIQQRQKRGTGRNRPKHNASQNVKIPPYTGDDDWKVWINRFEIIADRCDWDNEERLDNLIPRLQGRAGEFAFTQVRKDLLHSYKHLVKEISNRFRVIETPKAFAAKFSKRVQRHNESAEEYAAELKRLYDKAHQHRDSETRREDLVRKFLDGLRDEEVKWEVEYVKDPTDIDQAVYHVVSYIQTRSRLKPRQVARQAKLKRQGANVDSSCESEDDHSSQESVGTLSPTRKVAQLKESPKEEVVTINADLFKQLLARVEELAQQMSRKRPSHDHLTCYACNEQGHIATNCPKRLQQRDNRGHVRSIRNGRDDSPFCTLFSGNICPEV